MQYLLATLVSFQIRLGYGDATDSIDQGGQRLVLYAIIWSGLLDAASDRNLIHFLVRHCYVPQENNGYSCKYDGQALHLEFLVERKALAPASKWIEKDHEIEVLFAGCSGANCSAVSLSLFAHGFQKNSRE